MSTDRLIGRVVKVKTYQTLVELSPDTASYVKSDLGGLYAIATINSFVILPVGSERVVALVTALDMAEEPEASVKNRQMLVIARPRRTLWASMIGTIGQNAAGAKSFDYGVRRYPELDNPVWFASEGDLDVIFAANPSDTALASRRVSIGMSPLFHGYSVDIDVDRFFGKHAAILGNTGAGKSCTVTAVIRAVLEHPAGNGMPNAHFVVFDTNNEYESAFTTPEGAPLHRRLVLRNNGDSPDGLWVPHWFMNGSDYQAYFRPSEGAQAPLLYNSIRAARAQAELTSSRLHFLTTLEQSISSIERFLQDPGGGAAYYQHKNLRDRHLQPLLNVLESRRQMFIDLGLTDSCDIYVTACRAMLDACAADGNLTAESRDVIQRETQSIRQRSAIDAAAGRAEETAAPLVGVDTPIYFDFDEFVTKVFHEELRREADGNPNLRNWIGTLLLRLEQARHDPRYTFLFKPKRFETALASFLRLVLGSDPMHNAVVEGSRPPWAEAYERQYAPAQQRHAVTILDLSQLASDVLENVTALIGRLILEFMQRLPDRGSFPVVLVLEEAHHYIPANAGSERQQRAREVFEKIAKEGRKFGLSLLIASQRPSELSRTVLAQCNSFIVHRIQNPDDQEYFKSVISGMNRDLLDQLPALAQQHAIVLGDCVTVPMQVRINDVSPRPRSADPKFFERWSSTAAVPPDFEAIAASWESASGVQVQPERPDPVGPEGQ